MCGWLGSDDGEAECAGRGHRWVCSYRVGCTGVCVAIGWGAQVCVCVCVCV